MADQYAAVGERVERWAVHGMQLNMEHIPVIPDQTGHEDANHKIWEDEKHKI